MAIADPELADQLFAYESGEDFDPDTEVELFQKLIDDGLAWQLQGFYGRRAMDLINSGLCHRKNN